MKLSLLNAEIHTIRSMMISWAVAAFLGLSVAGCSSAGSVSVDLALNESQGDRFMNVRLMGSLRIPSGMVDGFMISELSGLAWDSDENLLYAVSDNGHLIHLRLGFDNDLLTNAEPVAAYPLRNIKGDVLRGIESDSEGLASLKSNNGIEGDTELLISFEGDSRVALFTTRGQWLSRIELTEELRDRKSYSSINRGLEAVTNHPVYGVITGPEAPMVDSPNDLLTLYAASSQRKWNLRPYPAANSALVAMETLPDNTLLLLERSFSSIFSPLIISLRKVRLDDGCLVGTNRLCHARTLAAFDSTQGWNIDNFEGLTRYRDNRYFIVSDDNGNAIQRTLLLHFEIVDHGDGPD